MTLVESDQITIADRGHVARISAVGATLCGYAADDRELIGSYAEDDAAPERFWGATLAPWPNRLAGARYEFDGRSYEVAVNEPSTGHALHGLIWQRRWSVVHRGPAEVRLERWLGRCRGYPFDVRVQATYRVSPDGLSVQIEAANQGRRTAPWGYGAHPYLLLGGQLEDIVLTLPGTQQLVLDDASIPIRAREVTNTAADFRAGRALGRQPWDACLTGLTRSSSGDAVITARSGSSAGEGAGDGVEVWLGTGLDYVQLFTPPQLPGHPAAVAIEPMSCAPDAFHSGDGLVSLTPGQRWAAAWGVRPAR